MICSVFEWSTILFPFENRTQKVSEKLPFKNRTVWFSDGYCIEEMLFFADNSCAKKSNSDLDQLKEDIEKSLEAISKWLRQSGLKVNEAKIEVCLFHKNDSAPIQIEIQASVITTKNAICPRSDI
jgi:hypothetical protein